MAHDYNVLIENGSYTTASVLTEKVDRFQKRKYGWFFNLAMNCFYGYFPALVDSSGNNLTGNPPAPSLFNVQNVDVATWAKEAYKRGVDYIMITATNEYGFLLYESDVNMPVPVGTYSGYPKYNRYNVTGNADKNIMTKIITEFGSRGIEVVVYMNLDWNFNLYNKRLRTANLPSGYHELCKRYYALILQEMYFKFGIKNFWLDPGDRSDDFGQILYNALKSVAPDGVIITNAGGNTSLPLFPADVTSTEEYNIFNGNTMYRQNNFTKNGNSYYVGQEIIGTPYGTYSQWYYIDDACPIQPVVSPFNSSQPFVKMSPVPVSQFQGIADAAKQYNRPFMVGILPKRDGTIPAENLSFIDSVKFSHYNLRTAKPGVIIAKDNSAISTVFNENNLKVIYKLNGLGSFKFGRTNNSFTNFQTNSQYLAETKEPVDTSSKAIPPL